jgi:hypothetical protein
MPIMLIWDLGFSILDVISFSAASNIKSPTTVNLSIYLGETFFAT